MTTKVNERALVLEMLLAVNEEGQYSHLVLRDVLDKYQYLGKQERAFLTRLMEGTLERQLTLDYVIDQFSKTRVKKMKPLIRNLMRMSVYQIMYMDSVPDSAVCNEAVKLARKRGFSGLSGFVNGVLRSVARGWREVRFPNLSVTYSMPEWIVDIWTENYGEEKTRQILEGLTAENRLTIRTNLSVITPEALEEELKKEGKEAICYGMGDGLEAVERASEVGKNIVVSAAALEVAKYLEKTFGTPYEIGYPAAGELVPNLDYQGKKILVVHQQVMAEAIRQEILNRENSAEVQTATWFMRKKELACPQDVSLREEDDYIDLVKNGGFDIIFADAWME